jgi:CheY-like chemotaxis protein
MALIIDDDPTQVRVIAHTLREVGLQVAMCSSGVAALEWLDDHTPDLITLDLMMPGMDGFTVLEVLRARPHLHDVPVLIITAKDIDPEDHQRLNGSIAAIIQKGPQQRDELLHELAEHLRQHQRAADSTQHVSA